VVSAMLHIRHILRSLPLLAAVLGDAYGVEIVIGGETAHTDGKTIHLPTLPVDGDATMLALARGLLDHEAAHIRETDFEVLQNWSSTPFAHHIWNSLEDWRVEKRLADLFPGCRQNFRWLIEHYFAGTADRAEATTPALSIVNAILLMVRSWDVPSIQVNRDAEIEEVNRAFPGLWPQIQVVLQKSRTECRSTQDAIRLAEEIVAVVQEYSSQRQCHNTSAGDGLHDSTEDVEGQSELSMEDEQEKFQESADLSEGSGQADPEDVSVQAKGDRTGCATTCAQNSLTELLDASAPADWPMHLGERLIQSINDHPARPTDQGLAVARRGSKPGRALGASEREACRQASVALRTRLYRLIQSSRLVRSHPGWRGKLDNKRLHGLAVGDSRVFLKLGEKTAINTAVHILLDSSGSMAGAQLKLASQACYAVASALERIKGINVAVSTFPAGATNEGFTVAPLIEHGERVHANLDIQAEGCTPLAQALWWLMQCMVLLQEKRKIILILSDGEPDSIPAAQQVLKTTRDVGFEVYAVGIQSTAIVTLLPTSSKTINTLDELAPAMFDLLQKALIGKTQGRLA